jgi:catechol 2,3-dioxygenase-like lactoylglutathione lyase family enzyme
MARGLDHVIHAVRDLDAAGAFYEQLGFKVGTRNRHPWGTHNRIVQFPNFFLEVLTVDEPEKLPKPGDNAIPFASINSHFLGHVGEGLTGMVLEGFDPAGELKTFEAAGFGGVPLFHFDRKGKRPDGGDTEVGFDIAFARYPVSPHAVFFTCKQTHPQNFWSAEMQRHANGAVAVSACVLVAENPTDHHVFLEALVGVRDLRSTSLGLSIDTPRGDVLALDPRGFKDSFGVDAPHDAGLRVGALCFKVVDLGATRALIERNGAQVAEHRGKLVVSGPEARGAVIAFEQS